MLFNELEIIILRLLVCIVKAKKLNNIVSINENIKSLLQPITAVIIGDDFNINLLDVITDFAIDFLKNLQSCSLHPVITLPTRVARTTSTVIDNFLRDTSLLPLCSSNITDCTDHYLIELSLNVHSSSNTVTKCNFSAKNKLTFSQILLDADWAHLYSLLDADLAFNFFIKKIKIIYNNFFTICKH